jgi:hypothetical protein
LGAAAGVRTRSMGCSSWEALQEAGRRWQGGGADTGGGQQVCLGACLGHANHRAWACPMGAGGPHDCRAQRRRAAAARGVARPASDFGSALIHVSLAAVVVCPCYHSGKSPAALGHASMYRIPSEIMRALAPPGWGVVVVTSSRWQEHSCGKFNHVQLVPGWLCCPRPCPCSCDDQAGGATRLMSCAMLLAIVSQSTKHAALTIPNCGQGVERLHSALLSSLPGAKVTKTQGVHHDVARHPFSC